MARALRSDIENVVSRCLVARIPNRHLRGALEPLTSRLLYPAERLHDVVECVEVPGLDLRATLGPSWPWLHRVVLLVTDRRLLELAVRPMGRDLEGRVRTFPWSRVAAISCTQRHLQVTSRDGAVVDWILRSSVESTLLLRLKAGAGLLGEKFGDRVCDRCGSAAFSRQGNCSGCSVRVPNTREVAGRGWTVPGAGLMMTRHRLLGAGRAILELAAILVVALAVFWADSALTLGAVFVGAAVVLTLIKIESVRIARVAVARAGVGMRWNGRLWDRLRAPGVVLTAALLIAPLFYVGALRSRISADLEFIVPEQRWIRSDRVSTAEGSRLRSMWLHSDGWSVTIAADALGRFISVDEARLGLEGTPGAEVRPLQVPNFEAVLVVNRAPDPDLSAGSTRLELKVFDRWGRDVQTLATVAPAEKVPRRVGEIEDLLRHAIWTDARDGPAP